MAARSRCSSCNADIIWTATAKGRPMPVDADPHPLGTLELVLARPPAGISCTVVPGAPVLVEGRTDLHMSHFETCPDADRHRRPR